MRATEKFGLEQRPTYEELADYIVRDPDKIKTPDRTGILLRDHFMLSYLHDIKDFETHQEFADEERARAEQFRRLRSTSLLPPRPRRDLGSSVHHNADQGDLARLHEVLGNLDHPVEYLPGHSGPSVARPAEAIYEAIGISTPEDLEAPDFQDAIEPDREHDQQCDMPHCAEEASSTLPCCGRRLCDEHVTGVLQYGGGRCPFCRAQPYIPGSLGASGSSGPADTKGKPTRADTEEDSIAWDLLRAGGQAARLAGKGALLAGKHLAWPLARGTARMAWQALVPMSRESSLARSPDGAPSEARALPPQPTPGSAVGSSEGFAALAITNGEAQQPIAWPRVSEVFRARIVGNNSSSAGVGLREGFMEPSDPGFEAAVGARGRSPAADPPRPPSRPPNRRRTGKKSGYPP